MQQMAPKQSVLSLGQFKAVAEMLTFFLDKEGAQQTAPIIYPHCLSLFLTRFFYDGNKWVVPGSDVRNRALSAAGPRDACAPLS